MARFLTTVPNNLGFVNLGNVEAYPTGGSGPTAYGPTTYFGSDPRPAVDGDNINNALDLGDMSPLFREVPISGTHGGLTRKVTSFYKFELHQPRSIQVTQNFSETALTRKTNRNTLISFYILDEPGGTKRRELPINDAGYVVKEASIDVQERELLYTDYPTVQLDKGKYLFIITNDFRYLETEFSITVNAFNTDWRYVDEAPDEFLNFGEVTGTVDSSLDFGEV